MWKQSVCCLEAQQRVWSDDPRGECWPRTYRWMLRWRRGLWITIWTTAPPHTNSICSLSGYAMPFLNALISKICIPSYFLCSLSLVFHDKLWWICTCLHLSDAFVQSNIQTKYNPATVDQGEERCIALAVVLVSIHPPLLKSLVVSNVTATTEHYELHKGGTVFIAIVLDCCRLYAIKPQYIHIHSCVHACMADTSGV